MKISIFCGCFYPSVHPRAFRAEELAKEFIRKGFEVSVVNMSTVKGFDYDKYSKEQNIKVINLNILHGRASKVASYVPKYPKLYKFKRFCIEYFICGNFFRYAKKTIPQLSCLEDSDCVIALSTPFECFYSLYKYLKQNGKNFVVIGDSGDPFYYSKQTKRAIWFKYIERSVYKSFDYLTIPTPNAIPLYEPLIEKGKIEIIPQGFNMKDQPLYEGDFSTQPIKIGYAGVFYWDIRNPSFLFEYLDKSTLDYRFYVFMRMPDGRFLEEIEKYTNLKQRIIIKYAVPRKELIFELSKMNFLVNVENLSNTQMPSKLIDYAIARRPILSCNENNYDITVLDQFMEGNYSAKYEVDASEYDIEKLADKFENLINQKRYLYK